MKNEIRLIIADDHPIVRQGMRQVNKVKKADFEILARYCDTAILRAA
jgi:DNA-binding NarL/FixJ family response regulator